MELRLNDFLNLETEKGWKVRDLHLRNGHHLVYKIPVQDRQLVCLPPSVKRKSISNIVLIRGYPIGMGCGKVQC